MRLIVFDLEFNQPSKKIIQIGAVFVDTKTKEILSEFNRYVDPGEKLSEEIIALTGITQHQVNSSNFFSEAITEFWEWVSDCKCGKRIAAWGDDLSLIISESEAVGLSAPCKTNYFDVSMIFWWIRDVRGQRQKGGLANTLKSFERKFIGHPHNALDDSINAAFLLFDFTEMLTKYYGILNVLKGELK